MSHRVWYAAYGSNLCRERFLRYLTGGPVPEAPRRTQSGARDPSPPMADRACALPHPLYFAGVSKTWGGGGVAYLDVDQPAEEATLGRLWKVTLEQLEDVYRQENREAGVLRIDLEALRASISLRPSSGPYGRLVLLDHLHGLPVITFTSPSRRTDSNPPHDSYRRIIARGLQETWSLDAGDAAEYLDRLG